MPDGIRFFLDENVPSAVATGLARRGIDVVTVPEVGRRGFADFNKIFCWRSYPMPVAHLWGSYT